MAVVLETNGREAMLDGLRVLFNSGVVEFQATGGSPEVATCGFGATAFQAAGAVVANRIDANAITDDVSATGGVIDQAQLMLVDGVTPVLTCSVKATGGGGDIEGASLTIANLETVSISALTITQPAS